MIFAILFLGGVLYGFIYYHCGKKQEKKSSRVKLEPVPDDDSD